jgi:hypothetical protein
MILHKQQMVIFFVKEKKNKKATSNLTVPSEYSFQDAMTNEQYILYQRVEKQIENGGYVR